VFYVSGHGFGHASRDIEVINHLVAADPNLRILVRTTVPRWLFDRTVRCGRAAVEYRTLECDTGIVQVDSLHLDAVDSLRRARAFMATFEARVASEAAFLQTERAALAVADIPPLGPAAARRAGIPCIALSNFTWDWIYAAYPDSADLVAAIGEAYAQTPLALRLPMHGGFATFPRIEDIPFIARQSRRDSADTRRALNLPATERLVLASFGGYGLDGLDLDALSRLDGYVALVSGTVPLGALPAGLRGGRRGSLLPFDESHMYASGFRYEDLVRAVDVVVTKPGYGIIAECLANDTALLYTSRGDFIEYRVLVEAMPRLLRTAYIDHADLFAGRWTEHLNHLLAQPPPPEHPAVNGADVAAQRIRSLILP
jgi:L-arabinokinase